MNRDEQFEIKNEKITKLLRELGEAIVEDLPSGYGFTLLLFNFGHGGGMFYISNARHEDMIKAMREFIQVRNQKKDGLNWMTREEHLEWAKSRALEYWVAGDYVQAVASLMLDLSKHEELKNHKGLDIGVMLFVAPQMIQDREFVYRFIVGFH
jgi:hypothetical protein